MAFKTLFQLNSELLDCMPRIFIPNQMSHYLPTNFLKISL